MENFKDIINGEMPVLVDYFATWCNPCKVMHPVIDELGKEMQGKIRTLKVDIDKNQSVANYYKIQSVPTFIIYRSGKVVWRSSGVIDKQSLKRQLESVLNS